MNKFLIPFFVLSFGVLACNSSSTEVAEETINPNTAVIEGLDSWLDNVEASGDMDSATMANLDAEYNAKIAEIDSERLSDEDKKSLEDLKERWNLAKQFNVQEAAESAEITEEISE